MVGRRWVGGVVGWALLAEMVFVEVVRAIYVVIVVVVALA